MLRAGYTESDVDETLDYLASRGYLNDPSYARELARSSSERKLWGPLRIERKLRERHLSTGDIENALSEAFPDGEEEAALRAFERFRRLHPKLTGERGRAKLYRHLLGRGFSPAVVHRLVSSRNFEDTGTS